MKANEKQALDLAYRVGRQDAYEAMKQIPIDMVLYCPACGVQHIDKPDTPKPGEDAATVWTNPPHRSHLCAECGLIWRPADVYTNGVEAIRTKGKQDHAGFVKQEDSRMLDWLENRVADGIVHMDVEENVERGGILIELKPWVDKEHLKVNHAKNVRAAIRRLMFLRND